jgi:sucrose phosphorylase
MKDEKIEQEMFRKLKFLYGETKAKTTHTRLMELLFHYRSKIPRVSFELTEKDVVLITYGDGFTEEGRKPLRVLNDFLTQYLKEKVSIVHLLPFFPYSSDDGFSVINYKEVNPDLGSWGDIETLGKNFTLMFDAVINHISAKSREFQGFLKGEEEFEKYFIVVGSEFDISKVFRPRALPLLNPYRTPNGTRNLWTTFSADQLDLNYRSPDVLLYIIDILLTYIVRGGSIIRLDAIGFLWKESGTECLHLPQTHTVIKLFRNIFDFIAPHVKIITETNVPHKDNISYFGNGRDEAHMVYNFALPPLTAHALITGRSTYLTQWAQTLQPIGLKNYFYNFTASHDGVGLMPARGILPQEEIDRLVQATEKRGGQLGLKDNPDGTQSVYELNISLFDLLSDPASDRPIEQQVSRFVASQGIALSLAGVPALYYHTLVGSRNYNEGFRRTGVKRTINREKLKFPQIREELNTQESIRSLVYRKLSNLLRIRRTQRSFHPGGRQNILELHDSVFGVERGSPDGNETVWSLINLSDEKITLSSVEGHKTDLLSGKTFSGNITIEPYEILWLT